MLGGRSLPFAPGFRKRVRLRIAAAVAILASWSTPAPVAADSPLVLGVPDVAPWYLPRDGVFEHALRNRLPVGDGAELSVLPMTPSSLVDRLRDGALDAVVATELSGVGAFAVAEATLGEIEFGIACLETADGERCVDGIDDRLAFWGEYRPLVNGVDGLPIDIGFVPVVRPLEGIAALLNGHVTGVFGERYLLLSAFRRLGVERVRFDPIERKTVHIWRRANQHSPALDRLVGRIAANPVPQATLDFWARKRAAAQGRTGLRVTTPLLEQDMDGQLQSWLRRLVSAIDAANNDVSVIVTQPFERSLSALQLNAFDIHFPLIELPTLETVYPGLRYVGPSFFDVEFRTFYTDAAVFGAVPGTFREGTRVLTEPAHAKLFGAPFQAESCIECAMLMLAAGRADAVVYASHAQDYVDRRALTHIKSTPFATYPVRAVAAASNLEIAEEWFTTGVVRLKLGGRLRPLFEEYPASEAYRFRE